jgi:hypothetical protein
MNNWCYFHYHFHPVGQGLFSGGLLGTDPVDWNRLRYGKEFHWVYDCGSLNQRPLEREISRWREWTSRVTPDSRPPLNLMVLSHFDRDHVNGLAGLIAGRTVDWLVLPYLTPGQRLLIAAVTSGDNLDIDFLRFLVDPVGYLTALDAEIRQLAFISPGGELPPPPETPASPPEGFSGGFAEAPSVPENHYHDDPGISTPDHRGRAGGSRPRATVRVIPEGYPFRVGSVWEFCFSNPFRPERAGDLWGRIRPDYIAFFHQEERERDYAAFVSKLKLAYAQVFGSRSPERNNISLVMYTGPTGSHADADIFWRPWSNQESFLSYARMLSVEKIGILYCGDLTMNRQMRHKIETHFGRVRWEHVAILQVPHHGSRRSWEVLPSDPWPQRWSVFASARTSRFRHPHKGVVDDLTQNSPVFVNEFQGAHWAGIVSWT